MFLAKDDGSMETILVGDLHRDLEKAKEVAAEGFRCLLGHQVCLEKRSPTSSKIQGKESANDNICHVTACSMRR